MMVTPTCQYCGFRGKQHLEVVNLRGNYRNNWKGRIGGGGYATKARNIYRSFKLRSQAGGETI